jgi:hypothetical protein
LSHFCFNKRPISFVNDDPKLVNISLHIYFNYLIWFLTTCFILLFALTGFCCIYFEQLWYWLLNDDWKWLWLNRSPKRELRKITIKITITYTKDEPCPYRDSNKLLLVNHRSKTLLFTV